MDWFSWLSKTALEPSLVYEYGLAFAHNELEEEDIAYFNHEFLQSIGISIAKHRLEIIKLVEKENGRGPHPMSRILALVKKTKRCLANCIHAWLHRNDSALIVVPETATKAYGKRWRGALLKRNKRMMKIKQGQVMMITDGNLGVGGGPSPVVCGSNSPMVFDKGKDDGEEVYDDPCWSTAGMEGIRWASMFQDLKPT